MDASEARTKRVQVMSTVLLAVAAVVTAWCSFQSSRWNAEYHLASGKSNSIRRRRYAPRVRRKPRNRRTSSRLLNG
jgi:hypothetical protein